MPWQLYMEGVAKDVAEWVKAQNQAQPGTDKEQFEVVRTLVLAELESLPPEQQVKIDAQGTRTDRQFQVNLHLFSKQL